MMKKFFLMSLASLAAAGAFARQVDRVVPIASDDNVKVELWLSAGAYTAPLTGTIKSCKDNSVLWQGTLAGPAAPHSDTIVVCNLTGLAPELWSPVSPTLYTLEVSSGEDLSTVRFGFRKFEMKDGNFYLNGKKIFLRGNAINPPGRGIPDSLEVSKDFARDYIRFLKGQLSFDLFVEIPDRRICRKIWELRPVSGSNLFQDPGIEHDNFCNAGLAPFYIVDIFAVNEKGVSLFQMIYGIV